MRTKRKERRVNIKPTFDSKESDVFPDEFAPDAIKNQLNLILSSERFQASPRLSQFLQYIVEETLEGRSNQIKGYTIGMNVYGRDASFDPIYDSIVRVEASRLRRSLARYYREEGSANPIRIEIPKGGYKPLFSSMMEHHSPETDQPEITKKSLIPSIDSGLEVPLVAILPFICIGDANELDHLAIGISEEIAVELTRFDRFAVIGQQSTRRYKDYTNAIEKASRDLGARFMVSGSIRKLGDTIRVVAQLTDAINSTQLWASTLQRDLTTAGIFEIQDEIIRHVVTSIGDEFGVIPRQFISKLSRKRPDKMSAYEATLYHYHYLNVRGKKAHARALKALEHAVKIEPGYALAWAQLAAKYLDIIAYGYENPEDALEKAQSCAQRAMSLDPYCQEVRLNMAYVHFMNREHAATLREAEKTIELNPNSAYNVAAAGYLIGMSGELERGKRIIEEVERINPYQPGWLRRVAFVYYLVKGDYAEALHEARRQCMPEFAWDPLLLAVAAGYVGNERVAGAAYHKLTKQFPDVAEDPAGYISRMIHFDNWVDLMLKGLEKAKRAKMSSSHI